jgi:hypothetical protein
MPAIRIHCGLTNVKASTSNVAPGASQYTIALLKAKPVIYGLHLRRNAADDKGSATGVWPISHYLAL